MAARAFNWVRLDTAFGRNDKVIHLAGDGQWRAVVVYCCALGHCREQKTAGFISRGALSLVHGRMKDAAELVKAGLWHEDPGGWLVHDWDQHQESDEEIERRTVKARSAAAARHAPSTAPSTTTSNAGRGAPSNAE